MNEYENLEDEQLMSLSMCLHKLEEEGVEFGPEIERMWQNITFELESRKNLGRIGLGTRSEKCLSW